jgi:ATP-dependent Clp protease ATP-binding subunit ClpX
MTEFDDDRIKRIVALAEKAKESERVNWNTESIFERLDRVIIGNERYKKSLSVCISDYISESMVRNHLLVAGPSGTGKTYLLQQCLPLFGLPFHVIDASSLVPAGIVGNTLKEDLETFFKNNTAATRACVIVLDEFDKISEMANGGHREKSQSLQSELLTLIQGKQEGGIDTRNSLWIFLGAFSYADEMRLKTPKLAKSDLLKYGFKNELLGRIVKTTMTDIPSVEDVVRRVANDKLIESFLSDLASMGYRVDFQDEAFLELALAAQNPHFGMRIIPTLVAELKENIIFTFNKGDVLISSKMVKEAIQK